MRVEHLTRSHARAHFQSTEPSLTEYLQRYALQNDERGIGRTFVAVENDDAILGYFTLSMGHVSRESLPLAVQKKLPRYPIPVVILGRLAIDVAAIGQGLGKRLLFAALRRAWDASQGVAAYAVVVDALNDEARGFYLHFGFIPFEDQPNRLFLPMASIRDSSIVGAP